MEESEPGERARQRESARVRGAFLYPRTSELREEGYYSWPGAHFDAEGHQQLYMERIAGIEKELAMEISMDDEPLHSPDSVSRFIEETKEENPDGLLLIPFSKGEPANIQRIIEELEVPTVILATVGIFFTKHVSQFQNQKGVYTISSLDNFEALGHAMRMIETARWMRRSLIISIAGSESGHKVVDSLGTEVRIFPRSRFAEEFGEVETDDRVREIADAYLGNARRSVEPTESDVLDAAKTYIACRRILEAEGGDAIMMDCLGGIRDRDFPPPCMAFMSLRDEGVAASCQDDLDAAITMMLLQHLFDRPGFQQNACCETELNRYIGSHCTCPTRLNGTDAPGEPYALRDHNESGVGVAPQVFWKPGQEVTMARYLQGEEPKMIIYSGEVVRCYEMPPAAGCRTNVEITINEIDNACDVKGMHQIIIYGDYSRQLRAFCNLFGIKVVT